MPKKYKHLKRGKTLNYDQESLEKAVNEVKSGHMSVRKASAAFAVPKSTIADRLSGRYGLNVRHGRPPALPREVEETIVSSIKTASKLGVGLSRHQIMRRTRVLCQRLPVSPSYKNFKAGNDWLNGLMKRFPELTLRKPEKLSSVRARMMNEEVVSNYFAGLSDTLAQSGLDAHPERIWNCDETGFNFEHTPVHVVAERGDRSVHARTSSKSTNLTVMACVNGIGNRMPPMIITKGKTPRCLRGFNVEQAPENCLWTFQKNGWIDDAIGEKWFDSVFLKYCGPERPQLLILDGHGSHETLAIIERAIAEDIIMISLPPHCTHVLQPLDRSVFGPLKSAYNEQCSDFLLEHPLHVVDKWTFPSLFKNAWQKAVSMDNIRNGFRACGIVPLNPSAVPVSVYGPSKPTDVPIAQQSPSLVDTTAEDQAATTSVDNAEDAMFIATPILDNVQPVIDISDPNQLFQLISDGDFLVEDISSTPDSNGVTLDVSDQNLIPQPGTHDATLDSSSSSLSEATTPGKGEAIPEMHDTVLNCTSSLFLPPVLSNRTSASKRRPVSTCHKILTSNEILTEKREKAQLKLEKEAKKVKKIKKEK